MTENIPNLIDNKWSEASAVKINDKFGKYKYK